tara:strand:+ start:132 stop:380 length:249 start_codon:yes stop_codon:yes gene_type:complete
MPWMFDELEKMTIEQLKVAYDKRNSTQIESREFILSEISRRENDLQTQKIVDLTIIVKNLTWAILALTILNLIAVSVSIFLN